MESTEQGQKRRGSKGSGQNLSDPMEILRSINIGDAPNVDAQKQLQQLTIAVMNAIQTFARMPGYEQEAMNLMKEIGITVIDQAKSDIRRRDKESLHNRVWDYSMVLYSITCVVCALLSTFLPENPSALATSAIAGVSLPGFIFRGFAKRKNRIDPENNG